MIPTAREALTPAGFRALLAPMAMPPTAEDADLRFALNGAVVPLTMAKGGPRPPPSRPLGGWLMTYGKVLGDGSIVETVDRDGHVVEAARALGGIDWGPYLNGGLWNDTHDEGVIVGLPESLEFHDGTTPLSLEHGKVGFFTTGRLFDRADPSSWEGLGREPSAHELDRADHFWRLAHLLKGTPRPIGLSAHGGMRLSPCGTRIIYAVVRAGAVCELPKNPDATLEPLELGRQGLLALRKGIGAAPCGACRCPSGSCAAQNVRTDAGEGTRTRTTFGRMVGRLMTSANVDAATAVRWLVEHQIRASDARFGRTDGQA